MAEPHDSRPSLAERLGVDFENPELLRRALTHRSWCAENDSTVSNERLEFLGDAVLDLAITEMLFHNQPMQSEGDLAKARAEVVSTTHLAGLAREVGLGEHILLGKGELLSGGRDKDSILADAMEAVIAATYLDSGFDGASELIERLLGQDAASAQVAPGERDYKTRLQELASANGAESPEYRVMASGPDHQRLFTARVQVGEASGTGSGTSKKQAERAAAQDVLSTLETVGKFGQIVQIENQGDAEERGTG